MTDTPTPTSTPFIPPAIEALFESDVTPRPDAVFSPLQFSTRMKDYQAVAPSTYFVNPLHTIYAVFSYDNMIPGAQWTALWYRGETLVCYETLPWDGKTGGLGYSECSIPADEWLPGEYEVQIFVGEEWKAVGRFIVEGEPPTATPTPTPTPAP